MRTCYDIGAVIVSCRPLVQTLLRLDILYTGIIGDGGGLKNEFVFPVGMLGLQLLPEGRKYPNRLFKVCAAGRTVAHTLQCVKAFIDLENAKRLLMIAKPVRIKHSATA